MTLDEARERLAQEWLGLADEALASARSEQQAARDRFAINRCYYACFYAVSAVLLREGKTYVRHVAVRQAVHSELVHPGRIAAVFGQFYNDLFRSRHLADYDPSARVSPADAAKAIQGATEFVAEMKRLAAQ
jgi:hypothetical protein